MTTGGVRTSRFPRIFGAASRVRSQICDRSSLELETIEAQRCPRAPLYGDLSNAGTDPRVVRAPDLLRLLVVRRCQHLKFYLGSHIHRVFALLLQLTSEPRHEKSLRSLHRDLRRLCSPGGVRPWRRHGLSSFLFRADRHSRHGWRLRRKGLVPGDQLVGHRAFDKRFRQLRSEGAAAWHQCRCRSRRGESREGAIVGLPGLLIRAGGARRPSAHKFRERSRMFVVVPESRG